MPAFLPIWKVISIKKKEREKEMHRTIDFPNLGIHLKSVGDHITVFGFDIADVSGSIRLFSDVMKRLEIKLDGDEMYEELQRIYDESVSRDADKKKVEDRTQNRG